MDLPKSIAAKKDALERVTAALAAVEAIKLKLADVRGAFLDPDEAFQDLRNDVRRTMKRESYGVAAYLDPEITKDGRTLPHMRDTPWPDSLLWAAMESHVAAHCQRRMDEVEAVLRSRGAVFMTREERKNAITRLNAELAAAYDVLGYCLRRAFAEGHDPDIPVDMPTAALLGVERDPDAEFEPAASPIMEGYHGGVVHSAA